MNIDITDQEGGGPRFYIGIDTHTDTHTLAVLNTAGHVESTATYPTTMDGLTTICRLIGSLGDPEDLMIGIEGTNSYGAGLNRALQGAGYTTWEVLRPTRQVRRRDGKSDPIDAVEAARTVMSGRGISIPKTSDGPAESLRYLTRVRNKYVSMMTSLTNMITALLITAPTPIREKYIKASPATLKALASSRPGVLDPESVDFHVMATLKSLAQTHQGLQQSADGLEQQMSTILAQHYPALMDVAGVGPCNASKLMAMAGDNPQRIHSEGAFAKMCGASPIPASSGRTDRHRLNRGGNRQANAALHSITLSRMRHHQPTKDYVARQIARGKQTPDIMRQLKRAICREIYPLLQNPAHIEPTPDLRALRISHGITQTQAATALGTWPSRISDIETRQRPLPTLKTNYHHWLQTLDTP